MYFRGFVIVIVLGAFMTVVGCGNSGSSSLLASQGLGAGIEAEALTLTCEEAIFFQLINLYRQNAGLAPLQISSGATAAARWHASDMGEKGYFSHTDSLGRDPYSRVAAFGYGGTIGENAAAGNFSASGTFCQWKNSPGHNANMLRAEFRVIGIGSQTVSGSQYGTYWSTPFGSSNSDDDGTQATSSPQTEGNSCVRPSSLPSC
jgi:uncharacterized protein YkwD